MPNPGLTEDVKKGTIAAVEDALREGCPPPQHPIRGKTPALKRACEILSAKEGRKVRYETLRSRLCSLASDGMEVDWSLWEPPSTPVPPLNIDTETNAAPPESPAAGLNYTMTVKQVPSYGSARVVVIMDAHDSPDMRKDRFTWIGRYVHEVNPSHLVSIGDMFSFDSLNRFNGPETHVGRHTPIFIDDIESGHEALRALDKGLDGWDGPKHETMGNHEDRALTTTNKNPQFAGIFTYNLDNLLMSHGWTYSPFGELFMIAGVGFTHMPLTRMGRPLGGEHCENRIAALALEDTVVGHTHRHFDKSFSKTGGNRAVRVVSGGCSLEHGHVEPYAAHSLTGWSYSILDLNIEGGKIRDVRMVPMLELEDRYGD